MNFDESFPESNGLFADTDQVMPALFVGHGSPINAIEDNRFSLAWAGMGQSLPRPNAIVCISAHWETTQTRVSAAKQPETIYDFGGFPPVLYERRYPAPGSPELARLIWGFVQKTPVQLDRTWGLDHGTWSVLSRMFPEADIPVVQFSLARSQEPALHYALGQELRALRRKGVLIVGSGNVVHNLRVVDFQDRGYDWAVAFDETLKQLILAGDHDALIHYQNLGQGARLAVPTNEHYLPLLYILALQEEQESLSFFVEGVTMGSISMRSLRIG